MHLIIEYIMDEYMHRVGEIWDTYEAELLNESYKNGIYELQAACTTMFGKNRDSVLLGAMRRVRSNMRAYLKKRLAQDISNGERYSEIYQSVAEDMEAGHDLYAMLTPEHQTSEKGVKVMKSIEKTFADILAVLNASKEEGSETGIL